MKMCPVCSEPQRSIRALEIHLNQHALSALVPVQKPITLHQFVKTCGSLEAAAAKAGVSGSTFWRWLHEGSKPQGNNARRLRELGVAA